MNPNEIIDDDELGAAYIGEDVVEEVIDLNEGNEDDGAIDDIADMDLADNDDDDNDGYDDCDDDDYVDDPDGDYDAMVELDIKPECDDSTATFTKHSDSVLCVSVDPVSGSMVATGGQDDMAYVWKTSTAELVLECSGHKDSVSCIGFSSDSKLLATGDMSGLIKVWSMETFKEIWSFEVSDLEWIRWHKAAYVLLAGTADGNTWLWKIPSLEYKTFPGPGVKCTVGEFMPDGKRACVGYEDGTLKVWDLKSGAATMTSTSSQGHQETVTCLACHHDNKLVLTGSTDMHVLLTNAENGKILARFDCKDSSNENEDKLTDDSVEGIGFSAAGFNYAAAVTLSGVLFIWDMTSQSVRYKLYHKAGAIKLYWGAVEPHVYTCTLDACVYVWEARCGSVVKKLQGHTAQILDIDLSRDSNTVVSASDDKTARVYNTSPAALQATSTS